MIAIAPDNQRDFNALTDTDFRSVVRDFLAAHHPAELRNPIKRLHWPEVRPWYMKLAEFGWLAPNWPREYGGMGLSPAKFLIYVEEFEQFGAARTPDHGMMLLGPLLIRYGNEEQRQRFLPKILSGEHIWCQGYSEPNAGSDLAALRTRATLDGEEWVVNGQKIWTTLAGDANWIFVLGANVVINDVGASLGGDGSSSKPAEETKAVIEAHARRDKARRRPQCEDSDQERQFRRRPRQRQDEHQSI